MILPADKGRASVILDARTYRDKMGELISTGPYRKLAKDPTDRLCRKIPQPSFSALTKPEILTTPPTGSYTPPANSLPGCMGYPRSTSRGHP